MTTEPVLSVVIPTYSRPELVRRAVESVLAQQVSFPFELVVVDDGGTPPASDALAAITDARLRVVRTTNGGPARARNTGMREARGKILGYMDDDCTAEPGWLQAAYDAFKGDVVMVQGPVAPPRPASPLQWHFCSTGVHRHDLSCNLFVVRELALKIGGFDERFEMAAGEDFDFCQRMEKLGDVEVAANARITHALLAIPWKKRRARPRHWRSAFQFAALHPEVLNVVMVVPVVGRPLRPLLNAVPPLQVAASVMSMQFMQIVRHAHETPRSIVATELAACVLNTVEGVAMLPEYFRIYRETTKQR